METFVIKLAVAIIPLVILVGSVTIIAIFSRNHIHHPLSWHRTRRNAPRSMNTGILLH